MKVEHIKNRTVRITQGGYAFLDTKWKDSGVLLEDSKLFLITDGEIVIKTAQEETVCASGDMVLIPAGVTHDYYLSELGRASKYWFHFSIENESGSLFSQYEFPIKFRIPDGEGKRISELFSKVVDGKLKSETEELLKLGAVFELANYYISKSGAKRIKQDGDDMDMIVDYISENLSSELSLPKLAAAACLSKNYFLRKFRARFGIAPLKYVTMARIERAKQLLANTDIQISDIMVKVGFTDSAHFSKVFKEATGYSPRAYRKVAVTFTL